MIKNKEIDVNGKKYNVKVELNVETERSPNGYHWNEITIYGIENPYSSNCRFRVKNDTPEIIEASLVQTKIEEEVENIFEKEKTGPMENMFDELGFENV